MDLNMQDNWMNILSRETVEVIILQKENFMKDIGRMGYLMKEEKFLRIPFMKEDFKINKWMDMVNGKTQVEINMKENSSMIESMEKVNIYGLTDKNMMVNGKIVREMGKVQCIIQMEQLQKGCGKMI